MPASPATHRLGGAWPSLRAAFGRAILDPANGGDATRRPAQSKAFFLGATLLLFITAAHAEIEFSGILAMPGQTLFALTDAASARTAWVARHGRFGDFVVTDFEAATDTLVLTRGAATLRLTLKEARCSQPASNSPDQFPSVPVKRYPSSAPRWFSIRIMSFR